MSKATISVERIIEMQPVRQDDLIAEVDDE